MTRLLLFRSLWTNGFLLEAAVADVATGLFDGIEGPLPEDSTVRNEFIRITASERIPFIAEIATGGGYVPTVRSPTAHLDELRWRVDDALEACPQFITALGGCDAWTPTQNVDFFGRALQVGLERDVAISFETHRSRPTFNPWVTAELLRQLPSLRLTCDFSHWCCVCERLVLDEEPELLAAFARHAHHIHARVGYPQGPQVPHPEAPDYREALAAHERWWDALVGARQPEDDVTMTPEFGPDGYLHTLPFSNRAVADLDEINRWMATRLRQRYGTTTFAGGGVG